MRSSCIWPIQSMDILFAVWPGILVFTPSTVLRSVRKIETLHDDPLVDRAVQELSKYCLESAPRRLEKKPMSHQNPASNPLCYPASLDAPSITALRYLA